MTEADNDAILNKIYNYNLSSFGGKLLFEYNISEDDICKITQNRFLNDVLLSWCRCKSNVVIQSYRREILWNNRNIKAGVNTIMFSNWFHNGIKVLKTYMMTPQRSFTHIVDCVKFTTYQKVIF